MKAVALFLSGFAMGIAVSWVYIRSLRATVRLLKNYIYERIGRTLEQDKETRTEASPAPDKRAQR